MWPRPPVLRRERDQARLLDPALEGDTFALITFPENAHWNADRQAVESGVEIGEYSGVVRVPRRVFQRLLPERPHARALR